MNPRNFFAELNRRKVYRVAVAYAVMSWLLIQIATQIFPFFEIPNWAVRLVIVILVLGFPLALVLSWAFDLTPQGIKRTEDADSKVSGSTRLALPPDAPEKSIAILPFENLSSDQQNTYFADGIQDDILSSLAKVADLKVISRTSVRQYRTGERNLREIGAALGVAHILEGTVRRSGNRVRINAQLINARTDAHIWADSFDREMTDLFGLQSELAERIATALRANLSPREKAGLQIHPTADLGAYDLYLRARDLFRWSGAGDPRTNGEKAIALLDQALARDPQFALAHCLASRFHSELYWFGFDKCHDRLTEAKAAAETALSLRPDLGDAHLALAYYYYYGYREYELARTGVAVALRATPNDAEVWDAMASLDRRQGRWDQAVFHFEKARQLDPHNVAVIWNLAETYLCLKRYEEAESAFAHGLTINPHAELFPLAGATIPLKKIGDIAPLRSALQNVSPEFDPGGAVTTVALRLSLMNRDHAEGARLLTNSSLERMTDAGIGGAAATLDGYSFLRSWYEALIARGQGDEGGAQRAFRLTLRETEENLRHWPDDAETLIMLGLIHAALGRKQDALRNGRRAVEVLPISKDAYDGPIIATNLAVIYAQVGEPERALELLSSLLTMPNGPTPGTLRTEPEWDSLRGNPRFEELARL